MTIDLKKQNEEAIRAANGSGPSVFPAAGAHLLERSEGEVIDLTRPIFEGMPIGHYHQKTYISENQDHETFKRLWKTNAGFRARSLVISEHAGTHTDAINEYDPDGPCLDEMPLSFFWGSAVCLDLSHVKFDPDDISKGTAGVEDIKLAESKLAESGNEIKPGDIVMLWFDAGDRLFPTQAYLDESPGIGWEGVEYLASKGCVNIATDCAGLENSLDVEYSAHMACKKYGLVNSEGFANVGRLVGTRFLYFGLPLNIPGGTGSPIRAFAWLPAETNK